MARGNASKSVSDLSKGVTLMKHGNTVMIAHDLECKDDTNIVAGDNADSTIDVRDRSYNGPVRSK